MSNNASAYALAILLKILFPVRILLHPLVDFLIYTNAFIDNWSDLVPNCNYYNGHSLRLELCHDYKHDNCQHNAVNNQTTGSDVANATDDNAIPDGDKDEQQVAGMVLNLIDIHSIVTSLFFKIN